MGLLLGHDYAIWVALEIFSRVFVEAFKEFIHKLLEVYIDDWTTFILLKDHVELLCLMLDV
jgi:hypothetical protein